MPDYRRYYVDGGTYFFTVVTHMRRPIFRDESAINLLRNCYKETMDIYPFITDALVILPDHLHAIWTLPEKDHDYSTRWKILKTNFSRNYKTDSSSISESQSAKGEKGIWQRRFWEHMIRNEDGFHKHCDYIHFNPVKHGLVNTPSEWKYSTITEFVNKGVYTPDWGNTINSDILKMDLE